MGLGQFCRFSFTLPQRSLYVHVSKGIQTYKIDSWPRKSWENSSYSVLLCTLCVFVHQYHQYQYRTGTSTSLPVTSTSTSVPHVTCNVILVRDGIRDTYVTRHEHYRQQGAHRSTRVGVHIHVHTWHVDNHAKCKLCKPSKWRTILFCTPLLYSILQLYPDTCSTCGTY